MGIFDKFKTSTAIDRLSEERLYEQVAQELKAGKRSEGVWIKAMAKSGGDLNKAESMYIELRVQSLKDELAVASEIRNSITINDCESILLSKDYELRKRGGGCYGVYKQSYSTCQLESCDVLEIYDFAVSIDNNTQLIK